MYMETLNICQNKSQLCSPAMKFCHGAENILHFGQKRVDVKVYCILFFKINPFS